MSLAVTSGEGVAEFTMTYDPNSKHPRLHQMHKAVCCPVSLCTSSPRLKVASLSVLGTLQMMAALISVGLSVIVFDFYGPISWSHLIPDPTLPYWVGSLFVVFSVFCIVASKVSSPLWVWTNLLLQVAGVCFSIVSMEIFTVSITQINLSTICDDRYQHFNAFKSTRVNSSSPYDTLMKKCLEGEELLHVLMWSINALLILLSLLQFCVSVSVIVFTFKVVTFSENESKQSPLLLYGQILKAAFYSPELCGVARGLRIRSSYAAGALLILTSLISVALQDVVNLPPGTDQQRIDAKLQSREAWVVVFGVLSILSARFPSRFLLIVNVINHLIGAYYSITSIVSFGAAAATGGFFCRPDNEPGDATSTPSPYEMKLKEDCLREKDSINTLLRGIYFLLIGLKVFQLCVFNCSTALGIRALSCTATPTEVMDPLLEEANNDSAESGSTSPTADITVTHSDVI